MGRCVFQFFTLQATIQMVMTYELASERWMPVHTVESIVLSIISMLSSPNDESPVNVEAAKEWRDNKDQFRKKVSRCVRKSQEMM
ncbi:hypothetical protein QQ045_002687 [Rhodiola kirilowii]